MAEAYDVVAVEEDIESNEPVYAFWKSVMDNSYGKFGNCWNIS